jgi:uncharacterized repeat protein (TIGR03803 family)
MARIVDALLSKRNWGKRAYAAFALCATTAIALPAQTFTPLFSFDGMDGGNPLDYVGANGLVQGTDGRLYGTTDGGGKYGYGTVFKINVGSKLTTLYNFPTCGPTNCPSGESPGGLIQATDGDFYGITQGSGGDAVSCNNQTVLNGCGTVFKITPGGKLTTLYSFCAQANCADGFYPNGLTQATNRDFYGTTNQGGANNGAGTVFKITPAGTLTTLYSFCSQSNCADGYGPVGALVQATNGDFYGTTWAGGDLPGYDCGTGGEYCGTVFKITTAGALTTLATVAGNPSGTLVQATDGKFYGTTARAGTIFMMTAKGTLTTLATVGGYPYAGLVQGTDGNFYGTTYVGGANNNSYCQGNGCGSVFQMTPAGTLTTLYSFCSQTNCTDGMWPLAGLMQDTNGNLYGTTIAGGAGNGGAFSNDGTVFSVNVGLGPFVETQTTSGKVGAVAKILGTDLTDATGVGFHGTAAVFTVVSASEITTTVPDGATTGTVQVVTPSGTLSSYVPFRVHK